ncbi:MBL fold metallo-hydrolase [Oceanicella actignis]|uniref:Metallo-beta-lactamase superfamily protein n=1 Tax=Oceanicella actignis TaxID=1189325 RepID=A0A1M7TK92_9RHOB|nr:MBL fold metallo-hydrolase [Oceanicella actignis]SET67915.1 Metallo-beta-lactamase superfamily protein [Oceanicella actignis]SHN71137.1 Metallo-beta-lactamase superfamily protein [Oceanicella actignis]
MSQMNDSAPKGVGRRAALSALAAAPVAAALTLGAPAPARAAAPKAGPARGLVRRFELGAFEVATLSDGMRAGEGPHPIFGQNVSAEEVAALLEANFLPAGRFVNGFTPTLVNTGAELILFDTGLGEGARPAMGGLRARLAEAGVTPEQIDVVVLTHMHPDHIGGLTEGGAPAFPNARYVIGAAEYDFWTAPGRDSGPTERVARLVQEKVVPLAERARFVKPGDAVAPGIEAVAAFGHTPGHMAWHLESEGRRLMLCADACNHYVVSLQRPDWHVRYDMDKEAAAATRKSLFGMIAADRIPFVGYHMPFPAVGFVEPLGEGFRFVPATYQFDV